MSPCCPEGLAGECSASDSLQTPTWSDAAAAETRMSSPVRSSNPNCEYFTAKIWTDRTYTCSRLHKTLCCVLAARKAEPGHLLDGKGYQIFTRVCTSTLLLCAGMCQLRSRSSGKWTLLQLCVPTVSWEIPISPPSPLQRTDCRVPPRSLELSHLCDFAILYSHS